MKPNTCNGCPLFEHGQDFTQPEIGKLYDQTRLLLVGEASGVSEARESLPFRPYGASGALLTDALRAVKISRSELAITNVVRCHPKRDWLIGAPYEHKAIQHCVSNHLISTIQALKPRAILAVGSVAYHTLTQAGRGKYFTLDYVRGYVHKGAGAAEGVPVIPTYHPAFVRRGMAHLTSLLRRDLRKAFLVATGKHQEGVHYSLDPFGFGLRYQTVSTLAEAWEFANSLDPELPLFWDCETPRSAREDEDERVVSFTDREMKLFQATQRKGEGIALPFRDEFVDVIKAILISPTLKVTQNGWNFDEPVAKANGIEINIEKGSDDVMVMFGRVEADLPANLQAVAQYCGFPFSWKHFNDVNQEFYGICDVDALAWSYPVLKARMEQENTWEPYVRYFRTYHRSVLRPMGDRGLPINDERRLKLKQVLEDGIKQSTALLQTFVPAHLLNTKQKAGLKRVPKSTEGMELREYVLEKEEKCQCKQKERATCLVCAGTGIIPAGTTVKRWALLTEFKPNSRPQVIKLLRHLKYSIPKHPKRTDMVTGEASDSTEVKELERLHAQRPHEIFPLLINIKQTRKLLSTYVGTDELPGWKPGKDGRIHATFNHKATWQPSAKSPNIFNGIKRGRTPEQKARVKAFNAMQMAEEGHLFVNLDLKSFHAQTMACEVGNADYLRLAKLDQHSFTTCHFIKHPERHNLLKMSNGDLKGFFKEMRNDPVARYKGPSGLMTFDEVRNGKTKSAGLGIGFGMQGRKLYQMYQEDFQNEAEAKAISNLIRNELFDGAIGKWQEAIKHQAAEDGLLRSRYGAIRRFYDVERWNHARQQFQGGDQAEAAIAFLPAANAFGYMRDVQLRLEEKGLLDRFELVNSVYDSLLFHPLKEEAEECIRIVAPIMEEPAPLLAYSVCPDGLSVEADAACGNSLAEMS